MAEHRSLICITCPMGCQLDVLFDVDSGCVLETDGNNCDRARSYAERELTHPTRMVTTTVRVRGGAWPMVPVHTAKPIAKSAIFTLLEQLHRVCIEAPIRIGQVIMRDGSGTGVDVVASRDLPARR